MSQHCITVICLASLFRLIKYFMQTKTGKKSSTYTK